MSPSVLLLFLLTSELTTTHADLVQLYRMVTQVTGKKAVPYYSSYGCYCGLRGRGRPKDATDRCCQRHDCCYGQLQKWGCRPHITSYSYYTTYGCYCGLGGKGQPRDATDQCCLTHDCCYENLTDCHTKTDPYQYSQRNGVIFCEGGTWCKQQICECDKAAAICLRDSLDTYNTEYQFYVDLNCKEGPKKC
ncbi:basic phospholipase A2-like [Pseudonaja textilis]|uniref:basic phospholipase A2-like n=1 Tax=Pseudonaja textilis TaxID=8673 RepID=UPI000EAA2F7A|nr:basic phospholipase A2-like [Pseudonaja textilis]